MIGATRKKCQEQIGRFIGVLPRTPETPEGRRALGRVLMRWAVSDDHAERIVTHLIETCHFCPSPVQIRNAAEEIAPVKDQARPNPKCPHCNGSGFVIVERGGYSGAEPCVCRKQAVA